MGKLTLQGFQPTTLISTNLMFGPKGGKGKLRTYYEATPLTLSGKTIKEGSKEKYLEDYISSEGLVKSTILTIKKRYV